MPNHNPLDMIETPLGSFDCYIGEYHESDPERNYVGHLSMIGERWRYMVADGPRYSRETFDSAESAAQALSLALDREGVC